MAKRQASEALDGLDIASPVSKKSRLEDIESPLENIAEAKAHPEAHAKRDAQDDDDELAAAAPIRQSTPTDGYDDLYLDTINRNLLDFDFERLCSVSLFNINVYAYLVCTKCFQGRRPKSHAYFHPLDEDHYVFVNLETQPVYVLLG